MLIGSVAEQRNRVEIRITNGAIPCNCIALCIDERHHHAPCLRRLIIKCIQVHLSSTDGCLFEVIEKIELHQINLNQLIRIRKADWERSRDRVLRAAIAMSHRENGKELWLRINWERKQIHCCLPIPSILLVQDAHRRPIARVDLKVVVQHFDVGISHQHLEQRRVPLAQQTTHKWSCWTNTNLCMRCYNAQQARKDCEVDSSHSVYPLIHVGKRKRQDTQDVP